MATSLIPNNRYKIETFYVDVEIASGTTWIPVQLPQSVIGHGVVVSVVSDRYFVLWKYHQGGASIWVLRMQTSSTQVYIESGPETATFMLVCCIER